MLTVAFQRVKPGKSAQTVSRSSIGPCGSSFHLLRRTARPLRSAPDSVRCLAARAQPQKGHQRRRPAISTTTAPGDGVSVARHILPVMSSHDCTFIQSAAHVIPDQPQLGNGRLIQHEPANRRSPRPIWRRRPSYRKTSPQDIRTARCRGGGAVMLWACGPRQCGEQSGAPQRPRAGGGRG